MAVLHRLPHSLEDRSWKLEHLIKEEDTVVGQAHLTWTRRRSPADQTCARDRMVWSPEWPVAGVDEAISQSSGNGMNRDYFQRFLFCELRQNPGQASREHRLARAWRTDHQEVV